MSQTRETIIVVFAHGWKHSAEAEPKEDGNILSFREQLELLAIEERTISAERGKVPRQVVGLYLGWRGGSVDAPILKELTFWDRKNTAHEVGEGSVREVLARLKAIRDLDAAGDPRTDRTRLVVIGHSFGGAVVFSSVSPMLEANFARDSRRNQSIEGYGDLVVIINPAFEANRFASLSDMSTREQSYGEEQLPNLLVLMSEDDIATRKAFPAGRWFSTFFERERDTLRYNPALGRDEEISQRKGNLKAIGHFDSYTTHDLRYIDDDYQPPSSGKCDHASVSAEVSARRGSRKAVSSSKVLESYARLADAWYADRPGSRIETDGIALTRRDNSVGRNPYLVVAVDGRLSAGHNEICSPDLWRFVAELVQVSTQGQDKAETRNLLRQLNLFR